MTRRDSADRSDGASPSDGARPSDGASPSGGADRVVRGRSGSDVLAARQRLEVIGGFVAFFTVLALVNAAGLIVTGRPSIFASLVLVLMLVASWFTFRTWRRVDRAVRAG
ncbi:hypothetical protein [Dietzia sp. CH92]|uniref:hypothetical protein n=1 Tax=Dietzia sp. CH92 TaxID=3051823 RepID=UPI0028D7832D|nr:hypothetical protein [Dietzia sp. CH92]